MSVMRMRLAIVALWAFVGGAAAQQGLEPAPKPPKAPICPRETLVANLTARGCKPIHHGPSSELSYFDACSNETAYVKKFGRPVESWECPGMDLWTWIPKER